MKIKLKAKPCHQAHLTAEEEAKRRKADYEAKLMELWAVHSRPDPSDTPFPLFHLPPELRLLIYRYAHIVEQDYVDDSGLLLRVKNCPLTNAVEVGGDFSKEYLQEVGQRTHLIIDDSPEYAWEFMKPFRHLRFVKTMEVHLRTVRYFPVPTFRCVCGD